MQDNSKWIQRVRQMRMNFDVSQSKRQIRTWIFKSNLLWDNLLSSKEP